MKSHRSIPAAARRATGLRFALPALAAVVAACGNLTAGGLGEVSVAASGDAPSTAPAAAPAHSFARAADGPLASSHGDEPEGELEAEFDLHLVAEDGTEVRLTDDEVRVRVDLRGRNEADVVETLVPSARYTGLRIVFTEIDAEIESGLVIQGVPIFGEVRVELDDVGIAVTRALDLEVAEGGRVELLIDLNAASWLQAVDPVTRLVDASVFADLIAVVPR